jgi:murein L,D-transpeptidase YafK
MFGIRAGVRYQFTLRSRPLLRTLLASAAIAAAMTLAGCTGGTPVASGRHMQPLSERMLAELNAKNMEKESPILVRIFKEEAELEVWKQDDSGRFALLRTYPICRWSGELGPKIKEGDRQAPEGFYTITPSLMNPNSNQYLAINTGFPNAYDRANGRTGAFLMIHGGCSSAGCYAMTDEQIAEIYALARESFFGGQKSFQLQAYPFRMTPLNMARHHNSPHMAFWIMLKQGYDHFEVTHLEPKVSVCEKRYILDAESADSFSPADRCPAYKVPEDITAAVRRKQRRDDIETAELINRGIPTVPVTTGVDGGMNPTFLAPGGNGED